MNQLQSALAARVTAARSSLAAARAAGDDYLVAVREGELDSLARLALANDVVLELDLTTTGDAAPVHLTELEQRETA